MQMLLSFIKFSIPLIFVSELIFVQYCFVAVFFSFTPDGSHAFVNRHKFKSSEIILPYTKDYFPVFSIWLTRLELLL